MVVGRSNSEAELQALVSRCNQALAHGRHGGFTSLQAFRDAGAPSVPSRIFCPAGNLAPSPVSNAAARSNGAHG